MDWKIDETGVVAATDGNEMLPAGAPLFESYGDVADRPAGRNVGDG